jgi:hypothetical protein
MGNTYPNFNSNSISSYRYNDDSENSNINGTYTKPSDSNSLYQFKDKYYSNELIDSLIKDISNNTASNGDLITKHNFNYKNCDSTNGCSTNVNNYNTIPNKDNLKKDPNLNLDKYSELKYLEEEIYNTESLVNKYYILLYVWFVIMLIILFVFFITILSNNNEVNPIINYIVTIFLLYCIYQIYKNIYNKL